LRETDRDLRDHQPVEVYFVANRANGDAACRLISVRLGAARKFRPLVAQLGIDLNFLSHLIAIATGAIINAIIHITGNS
jgi:hypothetical protein